MLSEQNNILDLSRKGGLLPEEKVMEVFRKKSKLIIGIPKETSSLERRVPLVPQAVGLLVANGHEVLVQSEAGNLARFPDNRYSEAGAKIIYNAEEVFKADIVIKVAPPAVEELDYMDSRKTLISALQFTSQSGDFFKRLIQKKMTAIAYEQIKDKTDTFPVRRSVSEIVGNTVILIASEYLSNISYSKGCMLGGFTGITPTQVVIIGAGTVGASAARAAIGLGAEVKVFDNSIYKLRRLQNEVNQRVFSSIIQPQVLLNALKSADVVIGAIHAIEGRAPCVVTEEMVQQMQEGAVIVDVSIDQGGCIETSRPTTHDKPVFKKYDVTHYCVPNIASRVPHTASYALSNIIAPVLLRIGEEGGVENLLKADKWLRNGVYLYNGIVTMKFISDNFHLPFQDVDLLMASWH
ncbi:MAG: alanine dehydrogenase [Bacteroidales bacterium]|nr:alanine dehydrogenase [Bacteroidales bacterium]